MSWFVAVSFPVLLMLFTVGLQRLEALLHGDPSCAIELVNRLEDAARGARQKAAGRSVTELTGPHPLSRLDPLVLIDEPGLPTRPNPVFQPSG